MSALLKAGAIIRALQLVFGIIIFAFWIWLRSAGYTTTDGVDFDGDDDRKRVEGGYGAAAFATCLIATLATFAISVFNLNYCLRSHYVEHSTRFHMIRLCGDLFTWVMFLTANLIMRFTPHYLEVYSVELERWNGPDQWIIILVVGIAKVCIMILLAVGWVLVIAELSRARRQTMKGHGAPTVNKNSYMMVPVAHAGDPMIPLPPQPKYYSHQYENGHYGHQSTAYA